jgi:TatD DNase family protein
MITDTHTHLYVEEFGQDRDAVIARGLEHGISRFFLPSIDSTYTTSMIDLEEKYPDCIYLMMGLHPTHVKSESVESEMAHVRDMLAQRSFVAVGEIGIDLYWDKTTLDLQIQAFSEQIRLAQQYDLPIVIHCREAFEEIFEVLTQENNPKLRGIFHCFTGTLEQAKRAISFNMKLGIGGVVTFKNGKIDQFLNQIPLKHIVLETDAPYLAPVPYRGKRNESAYISEVIDKLALIYNLPQQEIIAVTTENASFIFNSW